MHERVRLCVNAIVNSIKNGNLVKLVILMVVISLLYCMGFEYSAETRSTESVRTMYKRVRLCVNAVDDIIGTRSTLRKLVFHFLSN